MCLFSRGWRALHSILCCPLWIYEGQSELVWYSWCDAAVEGLRVAKGSFLGNAVASDAFSNCEKLFCSIVETPCFACRGILPAFTIHWFEIRASNSSSWKSLPCLLFCLQLWRRICNQSRTRWWHGIGKCFANDSLRFLESLLTRHPNRRKGMFHYICPWTLFVQNVCEILLDLRKSAMCTFRSKLWKIRQGCWRFKESLLILEGVDSSRLMRWFKRCSWGRI